MVAFIKCSSVCYALIFLICSTKNALCFSKHYEIKRLLYHLPAVQMADPARNMGIQVGPRVGTKIPDKQPNAERNEVEALRHTLIDSSRRVGVNRSVSKENQNNANQREDQHLAEHQNGTYERHEQEVHRLSRTVNVCNLSRTGIPHQATERIETVEEVFRNGRAASRPHGKVVVGVHVEMNGSEQSKTKFVQRQRSTVGPDGDQPLTPFFQIGKELVHVVIARA